MGINKTGGGILKNYLKAILIVFMIIAMSSAAFLIYTNIYYRANPEVDRILKSDYITVLEEQDMIVFRGEESTDTGLVFYPGGKVEYKSYLPLMEKLSKRGISSVLVEMPFNLAVFDKDAADLAFKALPDVENWFLGGHSLGGAMASDYIDETDEDLDGLILLGSYPDKYLDIPTLIIYGSNDLVLDKRKLKDSTDEIVEINGGNHAYFGNYGEQRGDGRASISREEQQNITVDAITEFIDSVENLKQRKAK